VLAHALHLLDHSERYLLDHSERRFLAGCPQASTWLPACEQGPLAQQLSDTLHMLTEERITFLACPLEASKIDVSLSLAEWLSPTDVSVSQAMPSK